MITLTLISETSSSITLGWKPVAGCIGYRFNAEKQAKPSHTWDPLRSSVKFSKGSAWYKVEALQAFDSGTYPPQGVLVVYPSPTRYPSEVAA